MAVVVILVLAILWAAVLLPPILRARAEGGGSGVSGGVAEVMSMFTSAVDRVRGSEPDLAPVQPLMGPVGPMGGLGSMRPPGGMTPAQRRRRDVLVGLLCAAGITLVMALFSGGTIVFVALHLITDVLLGGYVYLLLQLKARDHERRSKVRPLHTAARRLRTLPALTDTSPGSEPALALRRTATS
ncbi:MAG TPA: hypothetical protein VG012_02860 [Acidimicrobiia bacterium]|nr:hypothetical protein [Acidimicrobiia bacterium]